MPSHSMLLRRRKLAISIAVAPLLFAACGGSSSGSADVSATSWCDFADESDVVDEIFDSFGSASTDLEAGVAEIESFVERLRDEAPDEIKDDAQTLADGMQMLVDSITEADFNILDADLGFLDDAALEAELDEASSNIDEFTERECGRSFSSVDEADDADEGDTDTADDPVTAGDETDADDGSDFDPAGGTIREQLVAQFESIGLTNDEATCIADKLDFNDPAVQSGDIGAMLDVFDECGIGLDRLAELGGG